ncbi:PREDICTED: uncharacterized protein LOC101367455 [Odobenus rosmarus divergens]|uniref:Uncharacterized protein LOC101367455 n=1 Tax=Odobenus rosmarus divergens TaxID=9708 RepID=A0A2U3W3L8_ODORO|nr:PREDICTED: uncharacterized protein LOC101367455 [Odobenus rosmarus divergens]
MKEMSRKCFLEGESGWSISVTTTVHPLCLLDLCLHTLSVISSSMNPWGSFLEGRQKREVSWTNYRLNTIAILWIQLTLIDSFLHYQSLAPSSSVEIDPEEVDSWRLSENCLSCRLNNGLLNRPYPSRSPESVTVTLYNKRKVTDVIKLKILRWEDECGLSRCLHSVQDIATDCGTNELQVEINFQWIFPQLALQPFGAFYFSVIPFAVRGREAGWSIEKEVLATPRSVKAAVRDGTRVPFRLGYHVNVQDGGNQRELARQKNMKKSQEISKERKEDDSLTTSQRKQRDSEIMQQKRKAANEKKSMQTREK